MSSSSDGREKWPLWKKSAKEPPPHIVRAWQLYCEGEDNWAAIARALEYDGEGKKVKRDVVRYSKLVASVGGDDSADALGEAVGKLQRNERELWRVHDDAQELDKKRPTPKGLRLRLWALKQIADVTIRMAALRGVLTERGEVNVGGQIGTYVIEQFGPGDKGGGNRPAANGGRDGSGSDPEASSD